MHLQHPFYSSRRIRDCLQYERFAVNRKGVQSLMRQMGNTALYPESQYQSAREKTRGSSA